MVVNPYLNLVLYLWRRAKDAITSSSITKAPFPCESTDTLTSDDPSQLLPELLDRLVALGDMARQLSQALGRNGHRPEVVQKLMEEIANG